MLTHASGTDLEVELPALRRQYGISRRWHANFLSRIPEILVRYPDDPEVAETCRQFERLDQLEMVTTLIQLQIRAYDGRSEWIRRAHAIADASTDHFGGGSDWWSVVYQRLWKHASMQAIYYDGCIVAISDALLEWGYC